MASKPEVEWNDEYSAPRRALPGRVGRWSLGTFSVIVLGVFLYYTVGAFLVHRVDDDTGFSEQIAVEQGASRAVTVAAALVRREIDTHEWVANDPFFMPSAALDNMPNFQLGIVYAVSRFALEMTDQIGRIRGSSEVDADLDKAAGQLKYPGNIWLFDFSTSFAPTASSESLYRAAARSLEAYNARLASGAAVFEARSDNLQGTLMRIAADLGSSSAIIDKHLPLAGGWWFDAEVDDIFYRVKGRTYAYFLILRALRADFGKVIDDRDLDAAWGQMVDSMAAAADLSPMIVLNGALDGVTFPNHLAVQGFYLLRARTQLREIVNILQK